MFDYMRVQSASLANIKPLGIGEFFTLPADVISLGLGEPDFNTPKKAGAAAIAAIEHGMTSYSACEGILELREETATYLKRRFGYSYDPADEILITIGGSGGFDCAMRAFLEPGDEVLLPTPNFSCYEPVIQMAGGVVVPVPTTLEEGFRPNPERLSAAITERTKMLVVSYPNNPTGVTLSAADWQGIAEVLRGTNILVLTDEIYAELCYDQEASSILREEDMRERTLYLSGFSKAYSMTGWRLGYIAAPRELLAPIAKVQAAAVMCASSVAQYAAIAGLKECDGDVRAMVTEYNQRRDYVMLRLNGMGWPCVKPGGAFYAFPSIRETGLDSRTFCRRLLDEGRVAVIPGTAFGAEGEGFVRISYAYSIGELEQAFDRIQTFMAGLLV